MYIIMHEEEERRGAVCFSDGVLLEDVKGRQGKLERRGMDATKLLQTGEYKQG